MRRFLVLVVLIVGVVNGCPPDCVCPDTATVRCQSVGLTQIPEHLLPSLTDLDLSSNLIQTINEGDLSGLAELGSLNLEHNDLADVDDNSFRDLTALQKLDLSNNELETLTRETFIGLENMLTMDLSMNEIKNIEGIFANLTQLTRIDLRGNKITEITENSFRNLVNLRYLLLGENLIARIAPNSFRDLKTLTYFVVNKNPLAEFNAVGFPERFLSYADISECKLTSLPKGLPRSTRYLQLRANKIKRIKRRDFNHCPYISILILDQNQIEDIEDHTLDCLDHLQQLWLNGNKLQNLPRPLPTSLINLQLDGNHITHLPQDIFLPNSNLHILTLMRNNLTEIRPDSLQHATKLQTLDFSNNGVEVLESNSFSTLRNLENLLMSKNPIKTLENNTFTGLHSVKTLDMSFIQTDLYLPADLLKPLTNVEKLDLAGSPKLANHVLSSNETLQMMQKVKELNIESTNLTNMRPDLKEMLPNLQVLSIAGNRWHCDKALIWLKNFIHSRQVQLARSGHIQCFSPIQLRGRDLALVPDEEFAVIITTTPFTSSTKGFTTSPWVSVPMTTTPRTSQLKTTTLVTKVTKTDPVVTMTTKKALPTATERLTTKRTSLKTNLPTTKYVTTETEVVTMETTKTIKTTTISGSNDRRKAHSGYSALVIAISSSVTVFVILVAAFGAFYCHSRKTGQKKLYESPSETQNPSDVLFIMPNECEAGIMKDDNSDASYCAGQNVAEEKAVKLYKWEQL